MRRDQGSGLEILDSSEGPFVPHSNLLLHTTCPDCIAVSEFEPPVDHSPEGVEAWLSR